MLSFILIFLFFSLYSTSPLPSLTLSSPFTHPFLPFLSLYFTPLQELWALLHFADKVRFASQAEFLQQFGDLKDATQVARLHAMLKPYLLRRYTPCPSYYPHPQLSLCPVPILIYLSVPILIYLSLCPYPYLSLCPVPILIYLSVLSLFLSISLSLFLSISLSLFLSISLCLFLFISLSCPYSYLFLCPYSYLSLCPYPYLSISLSLFLSISLSLFLFISVSCPYPYLSLCPVPILIPSLNIHLFPIHFPWHAHSPYIFFSVPPPL